MDEKRLNMQLYNKIAAQLEKDLKKSPSDLRLTDLRHLHEFDVDIRTILEAFYGSPDLRANRFASFLNAIYTHTSHVFSITYGLANDLIESDPNHDLKRIDGVRYKNVMSFALGHKYLTELRKPVLSKKGVPGKAGLYELTNPDLLRPLIIMLGETNAEANKIQRIKYYDDKNNTTEEEKRQVEHEQTEEQKRAREFAEQLARKRNHEG